MKIVADENVDRRVIDWLQAVGHHVISISRENPSIIDSEVLAIANRERALLITEDKDFGELVFHKKQSHLAYCWCDSKEFPEMTVFEWSAILSKNEESNWLNHSQS